MKKLLLIVMLLLFNLALSGCQPGQPLGPTITPTPTATPTPSPEQKYCDNLAKSRSEQVKYDDAINNLHNLLESGVGSNNASWGETLSLMEAAGPISVKIMRNNYPKDLRNAIEVFSAYAKTATDLQISLNRETIPQSVDFAQRKIISCIDQSAVIGNAYTSFLRDDVSVSLNIDVSACAQLDLYYEEITTFCSDY